MKFNEDSLKNIQKEIIDYRGKTPKKLDSDWSDSGYRALSAKNIKTGKIVQSETIRFVDEELYHKWMKQEVEKGTILITSEAPFGELYYWDTDEKIVLSQRIFGLKIKDNFDSKYVYYYMTSRDFQNELKGRATGSTVTGLRQPELLKCKIKFPDYDSQLKISNILSDIDKKIELNNQINNNLYEIGAEHLNSLYLNSDNVQEISFGETLSLLRDGTHNPPKRVENGIPLLTGQTIIDGFINYEKMTYVSYDDYKKIHNSYEPKENDLVLTKIGTVGKVGMLRKNDIPMCIHCNSALIRFNSEYMDQYTGYWFLNSSYFKSELNKIITNTVQDFVSLGSMQKMNVKILKKNIIDSNYCFFKELLNKISLNNNENETLTKLRDTLLPKLMNGEIDLDSIEI